MLNQKKIDMKIVVPIIIIVSIIIIISIVVIIILALNGEFIPIPDNVIRYNDYFTLQSVQNPDTKITVTLFPENKKSDNTSPIKFFKSAVRLGYNNGGQTFELYGCRSLSSGYNQVLGVDHKDIFEKDINFSWTFEPVNKSYYATYDSEFHLRVKKSAGAISECGAGWYLSNETSNNIGGALYKNSIKGENTKWKIIKN